MLKLSLEEPSGTHCLVSQLALPISVKFALDEREREATNVMTHSGRAEFRDRQRGAEKRSLTEDGGNNGTYRTKDSKAGGEAGSEEHGEKPENI